MKSFFKCLLASIIGCGIVLGVLFGILCLMFVGLAALDSKETYVTKDNSILYLNLKGELVDRYEKNPLLELIGQNEIQKISLVDILSAIEKAKNDSNIKGIYLNLGFVSGSGASFNEIREAILKFKQSGKFTVAYSDMYSQNGYYVASATDHIFMNPQGMLDIHGYAANPMFYKNLLDKLGIQVQIFKVGTYKSAVEPYINTEMSEANRRQMTSLLDDMWSIYKTDVSTNREVTPELLDKVANEGITFLDPSVAVENKLVESLKYETEVKTYLKELVGIENNKDLQLVSVDKMNSTFEELSKTKNRIAIVYAEGEISQGSGKDGITDGKYVKILEDIKNNEDIKAVVFRVNSPGGSAFASEQIWKAVTDLKAVKPVVVSMGGYAASGGYYISASATKIIAQPNTITGSIGIFGMFPNIEGLTNKVGLDFDVVKTNTFADQATITRPMREDEKKLVQAYVERGYDLFLTRCAEGRNKTKEEINEIGQGRVWTGQQALGLGLVDELGGLDDALKIAAKLVDLSDYRTVVYPKKESFLEAILSSTKQDFKESSMKEYLGTSYKDFEMIAKIKNQDPIQARISYITID